MALVLTRRPGESIHIGPDILITFGEVSVNRVRVIIDCPKDVEILRGELKARYDAEAAAAAAAKRSNDAN